MPLLQLLGWVSLGLTRQRREGLLPGETSLGRHRRLLEAAGGAVLPGGGAEAERHALADVVAKVIVTDAREVEARSGSRIGDAMLTEEISQPTVLVLDEFSLAMGSSEGLLEVEDLMLEGFDVELLSLSVCPEHRPLVGACDYRRTSLEQARHTSELAG